jgi:beta-lactamase regulating signal transducer with metallopeptidase domain
MNQVINTCLTGLDRVGGMFCDYAGAVFIQSALLVILLFAIDLLLRKRIRAIFRYCLWMLVLVKLVLPPSLRLPTGVGYWVGGHLPASSISDRAFDMAGLERPGPSVEAFDVRPAGDTAPDDPLTAPVAFTPPPVTARAVLFVLWLVGVLAFLAVLARRLKFVRWLVAQSSPAPGQLAGVLEQCRRQMGVRLNVELRLSHAVSSPAVCGLVGPVVLMPAALVEKLSPEGLMATLIHELAHIKRGDLWVNAIQTFLQVVYFYNPFVWFANAVIRRVCEEAVDETVLVALGGQAEGYSNTLIDIGETAFSRADLGLRLIGVAESKKALQLRIRHMLTRPIPKSSKLGVLGFAALFVVAAVLLPMGKAQEPESGATRVLHFPQDQSVGVVYLQDEDMVIPETVHGFHPGHAYAEMENFSPARGKVRIPPGKRVTLTIRGVGATPDRIRTALESLGPDDLYGLQFLFIPPSRPIYIDDQMPLVARLTGLRNLSLASVEVNPRSLSLLASLPRVEQLYTPDKTSDAAMAEIAKMQSLKILDVGPSQMTGEGLRSLGKLTSLEVLGLYGNPGMTDDGLEALTQLRSLRHLRLGMEGPFTDRGMEYLAAMPSLKVLWLDTPNVTDEGLRQLSKSRSLERLNVHWLEKITGRGVAYLKNMPQLKGLDVTSARLTDADLAHFGAMPNLDDLCLPYGFTDAGISHLADSKHLKRLYVQCVDKSPLTDKALAAISTLHELEDLSIAGTGFTDEGIELLLRLKNLQALHLRWFGPDGLSNDNLRRLTGLPKLRDLYFGSSGRVTMSGLNVLNKLEGLENLCPSDVMQDGGGLDISGLKKLKRLRISMRHQTTKVGDAFVTTYDMCRESDLACLSELTNLEDLSLVGSGIGDAGLEHIASLTSLKYLQILGGPNLTDDGLKHLAGMRRLDSLFILDSRITGEGFTHLYPLKTIHIIFLTSAVPISENALSRLRTELPHLQALEITQPEQPSGAQAPKPGARPQTSPTRRSSARTPMGGAIRR